MITPIILHGRTDLLPAFVKLLRDSEAEVRVAAAAKVSSFSKLLVPQQIVPHIVPCVRELAVDGSQYVRAALAGVVMELAPMLGKQVHIHIVSMIVINGHTISAASDCYYMHVLPHTLHAVACCCNAVACSTSPTCLHKPHHNSVNRIRALISQHI